MTIIFRLHSVLGEKLQRSNNKVHIALTSCVLSAVSKYGDTENGDDFAFTCVITLAYSETKNGPPSECREGKVKADLKGLKASLQYLLWVPNKCVPLAYITCARSPSGLSWNCGVMLSTNAFIVGCSFPCFSVSFHPPGLSFVGGRDADRTTSRHVLLEESGLISSWQAVWLRRSKVHRALLTSHNTLAQAGGIRKIILCTAECANGRRLPCLSMQNAPKRLNGVSTLSTKKLRTGTLWMCYTNAAQTMSHKANSCPATLRKQCNVPDGLIYADRCTTYPVIEIVNIIIP